MSRKRKMVQKWNLYDGCESLKQNRK